MNILNRHFWKIFSVSVDQNLDDLVSMKGEPEGIKPITRVPLIGVKESEIEAIPVPPASAGKFEPIIDCFQGGIKVFRIEGKPDSDGYIQGGIDFFPGRRQVDREFFHTAPFLQVSIDNDFVTCLEYYRIF